MRFAPALLLACAGTAFAQAPCPQAWEVTRNDLLGAWRAELAGQWDYATLTLDKHPEYDGFRGAVQRGAEQRTVAGDVEDGDLTLEESADGVHIAATWLGEVVEGSCGKEVRGTWKTEGAAEGKPFILRRP